MATTHVGVLFTMHIAMLLNGNWKIAVIFFFDTFMLPKKNIILLGSKKDPLIIGGELLLLFGYQPFNNDIIA